MKVQFLTKHFVGSSGTTRMRCHQPAEFLRNRGYEAHVSSIYLDIPARGSISWVHRAFWDEHTRLVYEYAKAIGSPVVYDIDDYLFGDDVVGYLALIGKPIADDLPGRYRAALANADIVVVSTEYLKTKASALHHDVRVMRNTLSRRFYDQASRICEKPTRSGDGATTIAYLSGSNSHERDFGSIDAELVALLRERQDIRLITVGPVGDAEILRTPGVSCDPRSTVPYEDFASLFRDIDINLVPLDVQSDFCHAKSELKYVEAAACGVPSIVSGSATYRDVVDDGNNGIIAEPGQWRHAIERLVDSPEERRRLGENARRHVRSTYAPEVNARGWEELIREIAGAHGRRKEPSVSTGNLWGLRVRLELACARRRLRNRAASLRRQLRGRRVESRR
jgi:glycosyltransferase involved in cell wall biosynthesis